MAVAPSTNMLFVGTRKTTAWAVTDRHGHMVADEVKPFAPLLKFNVPNGVCWTRDGFRIVVERNRVLNFPAAEFFYEGPDVAVIEVVPQGGLIPVEEESFNHGARTCRVGPDGMLDITLGQPFNVQPRQTRSCSTRSWASAASFPQRRTPQRGDVGRRQDVERRGHPRPRRLLQRDPDRSEGRAAVNCCCAVRSALRLIRSRYRRR